MAYALQNTLKKEQEWLQQQDIITPLDVDEGVEWYYSFAPKLNGKCRLYLKPQRLNQALI